MTKDKRKGFLAGYKKAGPTLRFTIKAAILSLVLALAFFLYQAWFGASKELQTEAKQDREAKHREADKDREAKQEELKDALRSLDRAIRIENSSYEEVKQVTREIVPRIEEDRVFLKSFLNREVHETAKYYPSGYKREGPILGPTDISKKLKIVFKFINDNFSKKITGKQFKEMNKLLEEVIEANPLFPYAWFYRGMLFSFIEADKELENDSFRIGQMCFKEAHERFGLLLNKYPEEPFLVLYKGMTLTHLSKGGESILYLRKALQIDPEIFKKHKLLGIISFWEHIEQNLVDEWELAFNKYWE